MKLYKISSKSDVDPDSKTTEGSYSQKTYPKSDKKATAPQIKLLRGKLKHKGLDDTYITEQLNIEKLEDTPISQVNTAIEKIEQYEGDIQI